MKYIQFEDIPVWLQARKFVTKIYQITKSNFNNDFELMNQIHRAALSILLNIAEGFEKNLTKTLRDLLTKLKLQQENAVSLYTLPQI